MKDTLELEIGPDGVIRTMYQDGIEKFAEALGGDINSSCRASNVEWEELGSEKGWTVRSASWPLYALRNKADFTNFKEEIVCSNDEHLEIHVFETREEALAEEVKFFWNLMKGQLSGK